MEICLSNEWGTICNQMWSVTDAGIVCRQMGLASSGRTLDKTIYCVRQALAASFKYSNLTKNAWNCLMDYYSVSRASRLTRHGRRPGLIRSSI